MYEKDAENSFFLGGWGGVEMESCHREDGWKYDGEIGDGRQAFIFLYILL